MRKIFLFLFLFFNLAEAKEFGCVDGELVERSATFGKVVQSFYFSKDCLLRNDAEKAVLMQGPAYVNLEAYWPELISYKRMIELSKNNTTTKKQVKHVRSFITLSYSPSPLMIASAIDEYYAQKNYLFIKDDGDYSYFVKKSESASSDKSMTNRTVFIAPKSRRDFWVMCMKKQSYIVGTVGKVKYEINMHTDEPQDWIFIHEIIGKFINKIQVFGK